MTFVERLADTLQRDIRSLQGQVLAYPDDGSLWTLVPGVNNSAGTLALHLAGNLQHFVGGLLGGSGYVRERELEFSRRDVPVQDIVAELDAASRAVELGLAGRADAQLSDPFPLALDDGQRSHDRCSVDPSLGDARVDLTKVRQMLFNLLSNAGAFAAPRPSPKPPGEGLLEPAGATGCRMAVVPRVRALSCGGGFVFPIRGRNSLSGSGLRHSRVYE
ncbi:MAG: hypothetical protein DRQ55_13775 [Planctomycetota bacterium]|nr:MAG: hypothetical protein DRQ55_13775 [Planctomycetota bacterium]